jgi:hypothetical protein
MLETSHNTLRASVLLLALAVTACATPAPEVVEAPVAPPVAVAPQPPPPAEPAVDMNAKRMEEAKALLAQAETDVQRARAKRALWLKAWEDLIAARNAVAAQDHSAAIRHARRASEFAQLGLEQLAYPAVK